MNISCVEDDPVYSKYLSYCIKQNPDHSVKTFVSAKQFLDDLPTDSELVTLDYSLPDMGCEKLIREIRKKQPDLAIIVISAQEDISTAVGLLKKGAYDYIVKNEDTKDRLLNTIKHIAETNKLQKEVRTLRKEIVDKFDFSNVMKGKSKAILQVFSQLEKALTTNITVSISGETGTGKELAAKAIHFNSRLKKQPFVTVNMAAIPENLIESELFGHEKGAFTGADARRLGKFEEAHGGTLFLDEIAEMDLNLQSKLLRVIQEKEVTRIGGNKVIPLSIRLIIATHKNLAEEVKKGNFREDLYYRILGLPITLPPLRERGSDVIVLAKHFIDSFCKENAMTEKSIDSNSQNKLMDYSWPGNVRELKAVIELACVLSPGDDINTSHIVFNPTRENQDFLLKEMTMKEYTNNIIKHFLQKNNNNVVEVAQKLDVGKSTIYRLIKSGEIKI